MKIVRICLVSNKCLKQNTYGTQRPRLDLNKDNNWTSKKQLHISFDLATFNKQNMCHKMTSLEGFITALDFIQNQHTKYVKKKKG